ncbi:MAG: ribonuclease Z [Bacteroides sp.]|jgi:ribonuclease Z|nr:ribonuclease Z [Bacteroides sp.]
MQRKFQVHILGCSAATPTSLRHTTAQVLAYHNKYFLLDCGEGAQMQLRRLKLPMMKIEHIFISHLHGDHYLGLPGLLFSLHLLGRKKDLHIYAPPGIRQIIEIQFTHSELVPQYNIIYHDITRGETLVYEDRYLTVETMEMTHRIPSFGFLFREKSLKRNLRKESILQYDIPREQMDAIKDGADLQLPGGEKIPNERITTRPDKPRAYAFCSDTSYSEAFLHQIKGVDLMYHEATFLKDKAAIAAEKNHSTTLEAATLAKKAGVKQLLLGHYSARYNDLQMFTDEARQVFPKTLLAEEGRIFPVGEASD